MARQNERGLELSFKKSGKGSRGRWFSRIGGKAIYFGWGNDVSDKASYAAAMEVYKAHLLNAYHEPFFISPINKNADLKAKTEKLNSQLENLERLGAIEKTKAVTKGTISELITLWMDDQKKRNDRRHWIESQRKEGVVIQEGARENLSDGRYAAYVDYSDHIKKSVGILVWDNSENKAAEFLKTYRQICEELLHNGTNKPNTFNERMKTVRAFITWADENYRLDRIPRAIKKLTAKFQFIPTAKAIDVDVIKAIWAAADKDMKAYIALALNCGYYANDIAVLQWEDVARGRIIRNRNKTGVPTNYKLWGITQKLIEGQKGKEGTIFLGKKGKELVYHVHKTRVDAVADRFGRLLKKLVEEKKITLEQSKISFSNLRDTSSTFVENQDSSLTDTFDAHKDNRQARFYIDQTAVGNGNQQSKLDAIIDALEKFYGLTL